MTKSFSHNISGSIAALIMLILTSCGGGTPQESPKLSQEKIESKYASGVVLIKNTHYYSLSFNGGKPFYFTGLDDDGEPENLTFDLDELEPVTAFGTGFIVSKDGKIATNSHVASPSINVASARSKILGYFNSMVDDWTKEINEINEKLGILQMAIISSDSYSDRRQFQELYDELVEQRDDTQQAVNMVHSLGSLDYDVTLHSSIGIAYNDTHVTGLSDFLGCVTVADDPEHDIAIIQLKDKKTPEGKHVFKVPNNNSANSGSPESGTQKKGVKVGKKLFMIGFNLGPTLALTEQGVKAQITSGEVSQDTDDSRIMYTVSALHGSSGSPVIDEYGKLVAVNYAGLDITQNFNYGIKVSHLKNLLNTLTTD